MQHERYSIPGVVNACEMLWLLVSENKGLSSHQIEQVFHVQKNAH